MSKFRMSTLNALFSSFNAILPLLLLKLFPIRPHFAVSLVMPLLPSPALRTPCGRKPLEKLLFLTAQAGCVILGAPGDQGLHAIRNLFHGYWTKSCQDIQKIVWSWKIHSWLVLPAGLELRSLKVLQVLLMASEKRSPCPLGEFGTCPCLACLNFWSPCFCFASSSWTLNRIFQGTEHGPYLMTLALWLAEKVSQNTLWNFANLSQMVYRRCDLHDCWF